MKITKTSKSNSGSIENVVTGNRTSTDVSDKFDIRLKNVVSDNYKAKIASLIEGIAVQAEKLSKKVDIRELREYKRLVSGFLDEAVNNSHKFSKESKLDRRGRHRVYAIVKKVNEDLETLTQEVLKEEKDNLLILQKLDDIRGLILDIST